MEKRRTPYQLLRGKARGFTLIELMVVIVILGILVAIAMPNALQATARAKRGSCRCNQRNLMVATVLYSADTSTLDGVITSAMLHEAGYTTDDLCDCPSDQAIGFDDYSMTLTDGKVVWIVCKIKGEEHTLGGAAP